MNYSQKLPILIFSVERSSLSLEENQVNTCRAVKALKESGINFKKVYGNYNGFSETSFLVEDNAVNRQAVSTLCLIYEQECYLVSDENRLTKLIYPDKTVTIGTLKPSVCQNETTNYTLDLNTGLKWITE